MPPACAGDHAKSKWGYLIGDVSRIKNRYLDNTTDSGYSATDMNAQYVSDSEGNTTAVLLPIGEFNQLLEDLGDLAAIAERRDEGTLSHDEFIADLKRDGLLPS